MLAGGNRWRRPRPRSLQKDAWRKKINKDSLQVSAVRSELEEVQQIFNFVQMAEKYFKPKIECLFHVF